MKKLLFLFAIITIVSCQKEAPKDYVTLQGKISNADNETLTILGQNFKKDILVSKDGTFSDTLKVTDGFHGFNDGLQQSFIYLKNGYDITLNYDAKDFPSSISFDGEGSGTNEYLITKLGFIEKEQLNNPKLMFELEKPEFDARMAGLTKDLEALMTDATNLDPAIIKLEKENNLKLIDFYNTNYEREHQKVVAFKKGAVSPKFSYPDTNGKIISLDDLKGKYVFIDIWATWCGPCIREIPYLKEIHEAYENKGIDFVSLSIDDQEDKEKWLKMIKDQNLPGTQLLADNGYNSEFLKAYNVSAIPRFILIDKEGNILDADAPNPSDPRLKEILNNLNL